MLVSIYFQRSLVFLYLIKYEKTSFTVHVYYCQWFIIWAELFPFFPRVYLFLQLKQFTSQPKRYFSVYF